jgi:hypothetical protein
LAERFAPGRALLGGEKQHVVSLCGERMQSSDGLLGLLGVAVGAT